MSIISPDAFTVFVCALVLVVFLRRMYRRAKLRRKGTLVKARIIGVGKHGSFTVNGQPPLVLECSWTDQLGTSHIFRSQNLYEDPREVIEANGAAEIPVYFEPGNMKNSFIDMSALDKYTKGKMIRLQHVPLQLCAARIFAKISERHGFYAIGAIFFTPGKIDLLPTLALKKIIPLDEMCFFVASL